MRINNLGKKHYYVYQDKKKIGTLTKKKNFLQANNNSAVTIQKTNIVRESIFYSILGALTIVCLIWARPILLAVCLIGGHIVNAFDLTSKSNYYIKRPTGTIDLTDNHNYRTNADVVVVKRRQFLTIRFAYLMLFFVMVWEQIFETFVASGYMVGWYVVMGVYAIIFVWGMYFTIKKYIEALKVTKLEKEEQEKYIASI